MGSRHTCAVVSGGAVYCWGSNAIFALGLADPTMLYPSPTRVVSVSGARSITAGRHHTCITTADGPLCWGRDLGGELGDGEPGPSRSTPEAPVGIGAGATLSAGGLITCAIERGRAQCWGDDGLGAVGADRTLARPVPDVVVGGPTPLVGITQLASGLQTGCSVVTAGLWCWGNNTDGQLGLGHRRPSATPALVPTLGLVAQVSVGRGAACAVSAGEAYCWGRNASSQLGRPPPVPPAPPVVRSTTPAQVALPGEEDEVAVGSDHACARQGRRVYCWGANDVGQLGRGTVSAREAPGSLAVRAVGGDGPLRAQQISAGQGFTCAVLADGGAACWGEGSAGQLGSGTDDRTTPVAVSPPAVELRLVRAGTRHACAVNSEGQVVCWGSNQHGQLGPGLGSAPRIVEIPSRAIDVTAGNAHTCAALADGQVWCWGDNTNYQLGDGTITASATPVRVVGIEDAIGVSSGGSQTYNTCALLRRPADANNTAVCWGGCWNGACGTASGPIRASPAPVLGL